MEKYLSLQPPAECSEELTEMESSLQDAMQRWLNDAQSSNDARDRIAVANGISRGVFGSLHLGADHCADGIDASDDEFIEHEEFKRAA